MILYHGSTEEIRNPDNLHSKRFLDFGKGFYLTIYKEQAEKWAVRKAMRKRSVGIVNVFEFPDLEYLTNYKVLTFNNDEEWLDFVCECRKGNDIYKKYDIVFGNVADDDVFKTVDMYFRGIWDKETTIRELKYSKKNNQICIISKKVLKDELVFKYSYTIGE